MAVASLQTDLNTVTEKLVKQLKKFTPEVFTKKPFTESWSAAEVAEHLYIIGRNVLFVLQAEGAAADRPTDKKLPVMQQALADRTTKRAAPENVKPTGTITDQNVLIKALQEQMQLLSQLIESKDLQQLCTIYPHPSLGRLTRLEWIHFIIYHTDRHCEQLRDIEKEVLV